MTKHIGRITKADNPIKKHKDATIEGERSHVSETDPQKIQTVDPMSPQNRTITFTNQFPTATKEEIVKEKSEKFKDQVKNTDQYLRFVNGLLKEKVNKLQQVKDNERRFQDEMQSLHNQIKSRYDLSKLNPKYMTEDDAKSLILHLEEEYERMRDKLLYQELIVQKTKDDIEAKRMKLQQVKEELKDLLPSCPYEKIKEPISILREELKKAGIPESSKIFHVLENISEYLDSKNIEKT